MGTYDVSTLEQAMDTLTLDDTDIIAVPAKRRRRRYSKTFRQQVVAEVLAMTRFPLSPGAMV